MKARSFLSIGAMIIFAFLLLITMLEHYKSKYRDDEISRYLKPPNDFLQVRRPNVKYSQANQDETVYEILPKENGFYIEMGAFDGITFSNTLWLERKHKWTGLLIEANPELCRKIDKVVRSAWRLCACISTDKNVTFFAHNEYGGIKDRYDSDHLKTVNVIKEITVPCFTLDRVLLKINVGRIDYFSLDVEGAELFILNTIRKQLLSGTFTVGVWTIEYRVFDGKKCVVHKSKENLANLRKFFQEIGGHFEHSQLDNKKHIQDGHALDVVFVNIKVWCETHYTLLNGDEC